MIPHYVPYRKYDTNYLLSHLDDYLFVHNLMPTGFNTFVPPNLQWLYNVILSLEPKDPLGLLLGHLENMAEQAVVRLDPK